MTCANSNYFSSRSGDLHKTVAEGSSIVSVRCVRRVVTAAATLASFALMAAATILSADTARAVNPAQSPQLGGGVTKPNDAKSGTLLLQTDEPGRFVEAPRLGTDYDISVNGPLSRTILTQRFVNPTDGWVEAVYVFPVPDTAAVDTLRMVVGERVIIGEIKERKEARIIYERAKANGQKAALVEQQRPNIFTHNVANIGPGESIVLQLEYQQNVSRSGNKFSLRVPLVVAPRFNPKPIVQVVDYDANGQGWAEVNDPVPDRDKITAPVLDPRKNPPVNPVTLKVKINAGFPLGEVISHHHKIKLDIEQENTTSAKLKLDAGAVPANRDFELTWQGKAGASPTVGLFREIIEGSNYVFAFVTPPKLEPAQMPLRLARDVTFVIDTSGSMGGQSITQARKGLQFALARLKPEDRFNIFRFSSDYDALSRGLLPATSANIANAQQYVSRLQAGGGTMMVPPLQAALAEQAAEVGTPGDGSNAGLRLRQVIFLTDGAIGNEQQLFDTIATQRGRSRVFMVGIGSAPNSFLMSRAAEIGQGTFTHIGSERQVETRMSALFEKLENPAVTNLKAKFENGSAEMTPGVLPDLYFGEPLAFAAKLKDKTGKLVVTGMIGPIPWTVSLDIEKAVAGNGISKFWARRRIADLEVGKILQSGSSDQADKQILSLALEHHLVSRLTSLVAVEKESSRPPEAQLTRADIPLNLPEGWDFDKVFGTPGKVERRAEAPGSGVREQASRTPLQRQGLLKPKPSSVPRLSKVAFKDARFAKVAKATAPKIPVANHKLMATNVTLPQTATDAELRLLFGLLALLLSSIIMLWSWILPGNSGELK